MSEHDMETRELIADQHPATGEAILHATAIVLGVVALGLASWLSARLGVSLNIVLAVDAVCVFLAAIELLGAADE